jgi:hypothetical protein
MAVSFVYFEYHFKYDHILTGQHFTRGIWSANREHSGIEKFAVTLRKGRSNNSRFE